MNWWDVIGWAFAVLVVALVVLVIIAGTVGAIRGPKRKGFDGHAALGAAEATYPDVMPIPQHEAFVKGAEWQSRQRGRSRERG